MTLKLGLCALSAIALFSLAGSGAQAQTIAYLTTIEGSIFYPQSSPGGNYSVTPLGTGQYQVVFYGAGNALNSNVQVTAVDVDTVPHYCTAGEWYSTNGTDVTVLVDCFDATGNPLNDDFSVFYQSRTTAPASGAIDFLWANEPTNTSPYTPDTQYNFNSSGTYNTVTRDNTGLYFAYLPGVHANGGNPQVTAYGAGAAHCEVVDWYHNHSGINVVVYCFNAAGQPADEYFSLAFSFGATIATATDSTLGGYAWANNTSALSYVPSKPYQFNNVSSKHLKAQNISGGVSFLNMSVPEGVNFDTIFGLVGAYGSAGEYCDEEGLGYYGSARHETLTMTVSCFNAQGQPLNAQYDAQFITSETSGASRRN